MPGSILNFQDSARAASLIPSVLPAAMRGTASTLAGGLKTLSHFFGLGNGYRPAAPNSKQGVALAPRPEIEGSLEVTARVRFLDGSLVSYVLLIDAATVGGNIPLAVWDALITQHNLEGHYHIDQIIIPCGGCS